MQMLLPLIIIGAGFFPSEESLESVNHIVSVISEVAVVKAEAVETEVVEAEVVETEVVETEVVETEVVGVVETKTVAADVAEIEVVEQEASDVDQVTTVWAQLDPSTQATILMLVKADRMTHTK
jgi:hypothetical protein